MYDPRSIQALSKEPMSNTLWGLALCGAIVSGNAGAGRVPAPVYREFSGR
jgi:hypothetical protein